MAKVRIERHNYEAADGTSVLYARLYLDGRKVRVPLGISVSKEEWDADHECVRGRTPRARDLNMIITKALARINEILVRCRLSGETVRKESFLEMYENGGADCYFSTYARARLKRLDTVLRASTVKRQENIINKVDEYAPRLRLSDIDSDWLRIYAAYLRDVRGNVPGTVAKNMSVIKTHYYAAMREGLVKKNPFETYRPPKADSEIVYLNEEELKMVIAAYRRQDFSGTRQRVLGFWLFMAFSGMHIGDARALCMEQIKYGEIHYRRIKTNAKVNVPVSKPAAGLIAQYGEGRRKGPLFIELPCNQRISQLIKEIMGRIGVMKNVSAKTARHTFATLYYKKNPGDIGTLAKLLGHADVKTTMIYAHIMKDGRQKGMAAFDDLG